MIYKLLEQDCTTVALYRRETYSSFPRTPSFKRWREDNAKGFTRAIDYAPKRSPVLTPLPRVHPLHNIGVCETPEEWAAEMQARWVQLKIRRHGLFTEHELQRRARAKKRRNANRRARLASAKAVAEEMAVNA